MKDQPWGKLAETLLFGLTFLLFPLAHLKISLGVIPIYLAEIPLLLALGVVIFSTRSDDWAQWKDHLYSNKGFFVGASLFLLGVLLSFLLNEKTLTGLGIMKSFFSLPVLFAVLLSMVRSITSLKTMLFLWLAGILTVAWASLFIATEGFLTYDGRLAGLYESPNYLAMLLAPGVILSFYFFFTFEKKILKLGSVLSLLLISGVLLLTQSYGALASIMFSLFLFLWLLHDELARWRRVFVGALILFIVLISSIWSTQKFQDLITFDTRSSLASRFMIWESAIQISKDSFPWGIGPGNFQEKYLEYQQYFPPYLEWAVPQPHNLSLALFLQTGLLGLAGFLLVIAALFRGWSLRWKENTLSFEDRHLGAILFALLIFYLCYGLIDTPYFKNDLAFAFWGILGLLLGWASNRHSIK